MVMRKYQPHAKNIKPFLDEVLEWLKDCCEKANQDTNYQPIFIIDETFDTATEVDIKTVLNSYLVSNCHYIGDEIALHEFYFRRADFGHLVYYIKENTDTNPKYRRIPFYLNDQWETLPENEISQLTLVRDGLDSNRFFDPSNRIAFEVQLNEVINFPDVFLYNPNDLKSEEGDFQFNYLDHEGYDSSAPDWALRVLIDPLYKNIKDYNDRNVAFSKNKKEGLVNLLPKLYTNWGKYIIRYTYYEKGTKHNSFFGTRAIKLKFSFYGAFLEYLNQTIFYHFDDVSLFSSNNRQFFLEDYTDILYSLLRQAKNDERIKILYYVPLGLFEKINSKFLWLVLDETLKGFVTNTGTNTEDIVWHILKGLSKSTSNPDDFMKEMLHASNKVDTRFSLIYNKISGENFKTFVGLIQNIWFNSSYKNPDKKLYKNNESPMVVNYEAKKEATFFFSNKDISWENANLLKFEPDESWWDEVASILSNDLGELVKDFVETEKSFYYHPFQPIAINNFEKQQTGIELTSPLFPAFVLKAGEDVAFWDNVTTATEYVIDIATTFSGVGNIAKFRHLAKVASKARKLKFVSRTGEVVATAKAAVRGAVGVIEISAGTVNALLKITDQRDEPWAKELSEFLLILELCSLGADLGEFLLKRARKSAKNALDHEDDIRKAAKKEGVEDVDGLLDELYEVAELDLMASRKIGNLGGKIATERQIRQLRGVLKQKGVNLILEGDIKSALNQFKPIAINGNKFDKPNDLFRFMKDNDFVGGFNAETKQFILPRKLIDFEKKIYENPTEIVIFHEMKHLEHFEEVGEITYKKLSKLQKETYVWNKILAERGKWTPAELEDALRYINRERKKAGINEPIIIK